MKQIKYTYLLLALMVCLASCSTEAPFSEESLYGEGRLLTSSFAVELKTEENLVRAADTTPDVNDFTVEFLNTGDLDTPVKSFRYGEMPEVVTLPVGDYVARAYFGGEYGDGNKAKFDAPYFFGESGEFVVEKDKIVDNVKPIICRLANVKVSVFFDDNLVKSSGNDLKVSVKVGDSGSLDFFPATKESGFFKYVEGSTTLAAVLSGTIEDLDMKVSKTYDDVKPGNHYRITFKLHSVDPNEPGNIETNDPDNPINIDANVVFLDMDGDPINPSFNEEYLEDDRHPDEGSEDPGNVDNPDDPKPEGGPSITAEAPVDLDKVNEVSEDMKCVLNVHSDYGITSFKVLIESETLTAEVLEGVGLATQLDIVNPGNLEEGLSGLGLPVNVGGEKDVKFDISQFMPLLGIYGAANHKFILTVSDSSGTAEKTLQLKTL